MARREAESRYVLDTHALHWYLRGDPRLGPAARAVLELVGLGRAQLFIPAIVLAELVHLSEKHGQPLPLESVARMIASSENIALVNLTLVQLTAFEKLDPSLEMHDRLILADALLAGATLITKDYRLQSAGVVPTIW